MIITISGESGSGKSEVGKMLAERLGYEIYSMGDLRGKMALERSITIDELNSIGESQAWTDNEVDEYQRKLGETEDNFIIDGRMSFYCIPHSFKIYFKVDEEEGARRVFANQRKDEPQANTPEEMIDILRLRKESDKRRYKKHYEIDGYNPEHHDLIIDTTYLSQEKALKLILKHSRIASNI